MASGKPNVLMIVVDDLRPQLGCYGREQMVTPCIDALAERSVVFNRAYCQVPVCGATRASLLSGVRPTRDRFVDFKTVTDDDLPGVLTLPEHLRACSYTTAACGKVFHHRMDTAERSWDSTPWHPGGGGGWRNYLIEENAARASANERGAGPPFECADVPDEAYYDGQIARQAVAELERLSKDDRPFFLAAGFLKPHLPFNAPRKYWDLYKRDDVPLADNPYRPDGAPDQAMHTWGELRQYFDVPAEGALDDELARTLVHGYYAATSYMDAQVGLVLAALDRLNLRKDTVVVFWGDHGWQLGEHSLWCKHCNFNTSLNAPLIVSSPDMAGGVTSAALAEFVDVYPTICGLTGIASPEHLEGADLGPVMTGSDAGKRAVFSRFYAGDSVRTDRYLYTEWTDDAGAVTGRMLYDHEADPDENQSLADDPGHAAVVAEHAKLLREGWRGVA